MSGEQSGALRYYTGRSIVRWDFLDPAALDAVEHALTRAGRDMWIVLDDWEVALFREKFAATPAGALDWPPVLDAGTLGRVQAWRVGNRQPFLGGGHAIVDRVR